MNLNGLIRQAHRQVPPQARSSVTLTNTQTGATTTGQAIGVPGEDILEGTVRRSSERFVMLPDGLDFAPGVGMLVTRGSVTWRIIGLAVLNPSGGSANQYRLTVTR